MGCPNCGMVGTGGIHCMNCGARKVPEAKDEAVAFVPRLELTPEEKLASYRAWVALADEADEVEGEDVVEEMTLEDAEEEVVAKPFRRRRR